MSCNTCTLCDEAGAKARTCAPAASQSPSPSAGTDAPGASRPVRIALLGQPNSGKSTLFNGLTGARQKVGNWPGKTVEKKTGTFSHAGASYEICDLPGSYSLIANSPEEIVTRDYIASRTADVVCILADASQLERSLYMLADFVGTSTPAMLVVNLIDVAEGQGKRIDCALLEKNLGIPVVPFVAADVKHYEGFFGALARTVCERPVVDERALCELYRKKMGKSFQEAERALSTSDFSPYSASWLAAKVLEGDAAAFDMARARLSGEQAKALDSARATCENAIVNASSARFAWIEGALDGVCPEASSGAKRALSKFDRIATGSRASKPIALAMIVVGLLLAFVPATPIMLVGGCISSLGMMVADALASAGAPAVLGSFLSGVVFNSLCFGVMMVGYVFGINLVFGVYEETGYMARISYVFDATMARFGLQGKSVMPFLACLGCTMGGASGSRVIDSWGQRMLTVAMAWAVPCGSTWGVVPVLAVAFFGMGAPLVVVAIFLVMIVLMFLIGKLFGPKLVDSEERAGMVMELPPYHKPRWGNILRGSVLKSRRMFVRAIRVVAIFTAIIWVLTYTPSGAVEGSLLYAVGTAIEPVTRLFGMGWETFTAWACALAIKESALGVLSGLFAGTGTPNAAIIGAVAGTTAVAANIGDVMAQVISQPEALAFIFAFTFNVPCAASLSATFAEVHSVKWTALTALFYLCASLLLGCIAYHVGMLIF